jgi:hypothetical protein
MADRPFREDEAYEIYSNKNKKTGLGVTVRHDPTTKRNRIVHTQDMRQVVKQIKDHRDSNDYSDPKTARYFNENVHDGDRIIASLPKSAEQFWPGLWDPETGEIDDVELAKFLDKNPWFKRLDVGWSRQKHRKSIVTENFRENFDKIK